MTDAARNDPAVPGGLIRTAWLVVLLAVCGVAAVWHITGHMVVSLERPLNNCSTVCRLPASNKVWQRVAKS